MPSRPYPRPASARCCPICSSPARPAHAIVPRKIGVFSSSGAGQSRLECAACCGNLQSHDQDCRLGAPVRVAPRFASYCCFALIPLRLRPAAAGGAAAAHLRLFQVLRPREQKGYPVSSSTSTKPASRRSGSGRGRHDRGDLVNRLTQLGALPSVSTSSLPSPTACRPRSGAKLPRIDAETRAKLDSLPRTMTCWPMPSSTPRRRRRGGSRSRNRSTR